MVTHYQTKYLAWQLTRRLSSEDEDKLTGAILDAQIDLKPYQVDAALFAFRNPLNKGVLLADEVGLGKNDRGRIGNCSEVGRAQTQNIDNCTR